MLNTTRRTVLSAQVQCDFAADDSKSKAKRAEDKRDAVSVAQAAKAAKAAGGVVPRITRAVLGESKKVGCTMRFSINVKLFSPYIATIKLQEKQHCGHGPALVAELGEEGGASCDHSPAAARLSGYTKLSTEVLEAIQSMIYNDISDAQIIQRIQREMIEAYQQPGDDRDAAVGRIKVAGRMRDFCVSAHDVDNARRNLDQLKWCRDRANDAKSLHLWVEMNQDKVVYYQRQIEGRQPFVLCFNTPWMQQQLQKYGHKAPLLMDSTFSTNNRKVSRVGTALRQ